jgi:hypothetical protein
VGDPLAGAERAHRPRPRCARRPHQVAREAVVEADHQVAAIGERQIVRADHLGRRDRGDLGRAALAVAHRLAAAGAGDALAVRDPLGLRAAERVDQRLRGRRVGAALGVVAAREAVGRAADAPDRDPPAHQAVVRGDGPGAAAQQAEAAVDERVAGAGHQVAAIFGAGRQLARDLATVGRHRPQHLGLDRRDAVDGAAVGEPRPHRLRARGGGRRRQVQRAGVSADAAAGLGAARGQHVPG